MEPLTKPHEIKTRRMISESTLLTEQLEKHLREEDYEMHEEYIEVIISGEYSQPARMAVRNSYQQAGWKEVIHKSSSENGERPGLTSFKFYF